MSKKQHLLAEAERLFVIEQMTINEISSRLGASEKTIRNWKAEDHWDDKRASYLKGRQSFHEELYSFARKLMESIKTDLDDKVAVDTGRMYAFTRLLPMILKVKDYEDVVKKNEQGAKPISSEELAAVVRRSLGVE